MDFTLVTSLEDMMVELTRNVNQLTINVNSLQIEMREFKDVMNKKRGELSNKMGTMAEDGERLGLIVLGMGDHLLQVLNSSEFSPRPF